MEHKLQNSNQRIPICPTTEEEAIYGPIGALQLKITNDYENMTRENTMRLLTEFYRYLWPDESSEEIEKLGQGTALWIWNNRKRTPVHHIERVYAGGDKARKRKAEDEKLDKSEKPDKPDKLPRFKVAEDVPRVREDFMSIPCMANIIGGNK
jgi:hypothetical protein